MPEGPRRLPSRGGRGAHASNRVGRSAYAAMSGELPDAVTRVEALAIDGAVLFDRVNKNGDGIICVKPFANKDGVVLKDNTSVGPKS